MNNEKQRTKICESCEHAINDNKWCCEFRCPIAEEYDVILRCFAYEPKSYQNLFEAYEAEKQRKENNK